VNLDASQSKYMPPIAKVPSMPLLISK